MAPQMWEVVGGGDKGGIVVRDGQDLKSAEKPSRLATGALVRQLELVGDRLRYERVAGGGPATGWISTTLKGKDLVTKTDKGPPPAAKLVPGSVKAQAPPQCQQTPGQPFVFYHQINFSETKPSGVRMSACLVALDESRVDLHSYCDNSAEMLRNAQDPHCEIAIELKPAILQLRQDASKDGIIYTHPDSRGAVMSWLRCETQFGYPSFPFKTEEQQLYLVGKQKDSAQRVPIAQGHCLKAYVDDDTAALCAEDPWKEQFETFYAKVKSGHSLDRLNVMPLKKLYQAEGRPFAPTVFKKVSWLMSYMYGDLWSLLYHGKTPELVWELNMLAGGPFADLVKDEPDPQALTVSLPKKMKFGQVYDGLCFLEEESQRAAYVLLPQGETNAAEVVLAVCARFRWEGAPEDGRTLRSEDFDVNARMSINTFVKFALEGAEAKAGKALDLTKLPRP